MSSYCFQAAWLRVGGVGEKYEGLLEEASFQYDFSSCQTILLEPVERVQPQVRKSQYSQGLAERILAFYWTSGRSFADFYFPPTLPVGI